MNAAQEDTERGAPSSTAMRAAAAWFLDQRMLSRHESLKRFADDFTAFIGHLIAKIEQLAAGLPGNDVSARVAMVGVGEAKRRLHEPEASGLLGETERVQRLARSVRVLCDHHDGLAGACMPLACDEPAEDGRPLAGARAEALR